MNNEETHNLQKVFKKLDKNNDGKLDEEELISAFSVLDEEAAKEMALKTMGCADQNLSGHIDFTGFYYLI